MFIILISLCAGIITVLLVMALYALLQRLDLEKKLKQQYEGAVAVKNKGLTGNALFMADKIGAWLEKKRVPFLENKAQDIKLKCSILGDAWQRISPYTVIGVQVLFGLSCIFVMVLVLEIYNIIILLIAGVGASFLPVYFLTEKVSFKQNAIFRELPDFLDILTLMLEAGLDFGNAMTRITDLDKGVLSMEFKKALQEVKLGKPRMEAFDDMARRLQSPQLTTVVSSIGTAVKMGGSLAPTLRTLSEQFRNERAQRAEKKASEAPVKMLGPLVLLIFPTIFIILFGPILLSFMGN